MAGKPRTASTPPFDYSNWLGRAKQFVEGLGSLPGEIETRATIDPPLDKREADALAKRLPQGLPAPIRDFVTRGSAKCDCRYWWAPPERLAPALDEIFTESFIYGGPVLCDVRRFLEWQTGRLDWAANFSATDPATAKDHDLWTRCTPFAEICNGDMLALDTTLGGAKAAPVVYLSHEGGSAIISNSFEEFLTHWEAMSYIGPEGWLLSYWIDGAEGRIDPAHPKSAKLRRLLAKR